MSVSVIEIYYKDQKYECLVDKEDLEILSGYKWYLFQNRKNGNKYASTYKDGKILYMHRLLMNTPQDLQVDHINRNGLDNRKCNLRNVDRSTNQRNRGMQSNNQTGQRGVFFDTQTGKYRVQIRINGKKISFGRYSCLEEAKAVAKEVLKENGI